MLALGSIHAGPYLETLPLSLVSTLSITDSVRRCRQSRVLSGIHKRGRVRTGCSKLQRCVCQGHFRLSRTKHGLLAN